MERELASSGGVLAPVEMVLAPDGEGIKKARKAGVS